jgi:hypothetical protein
MIGPPNAERDARCPRSAPLEIKSPHPSNNTRPAGSREQNSWVNAPARLRHLAEHLNRLDPGSGLRSSAISPTYLNEYVRRLQREAETQVRGLATSTVVVLASVRLARVSAQ